MSTKGVEEEKERVRQMLKEAFANVPCPEEYKRADACGPMFHEECVELRRDFYNLTAEQLQYDLPYILEDALDTHTENDIETEDIEYLVLQLDPFRDNNPVIQRICLEHFSGFTPEQAQAICEWLRLARTWEDLKRFSAWVDAAISYWCRRAKEGGGGTP